MREAIPWFRDPLDFLTNFDAMERESRSLDMFAEDERSSQVFHIKRCSAFSPA